MRSGAPLTAHTFCKNAAGGTRGRGGSLCRVVRVRSHGCHGEAYNTLISLISPRSEWVEGLKKWSNDETRDGVTSTSVTRTAKRDQWYCISWLREDLMPAIAERVKDTEHGPIGFRISDVDGGTFEKCLRRKR